MATLLTERNYLTKESPNFDKNNLLTCCTAIKTSDSLTQKFPREENVLEVTQVVTWHLLRKVARIKWRGRLNKLNVANIWCCTKVQILFYEVGLIKFWEKQHIPGLKLEDVFGFAKISLDWLHYFHWITRICIGNRKLLISAKIIWSLRLFQISHSFPTQEVSLF